MFYQKCANFWRENLKPVQLSEVADSISSKFEEAFRKDYGGIPLYIRKSKELTTRNDEIWSKFTGKNHIELCREYNLSYQQICEIIGLQRKKRQGDLFPND